MADTTMGNGLINAYADWVGISVRRSMMMLAVSVMIVIVGSTAHWGAINKADMEYVGFAIAIVGSWVQIVAGLMLAGFTGFALTTRWKRNVK